ncbi:hypothetical protein STIAU_7050 [Stigmatella aurantiaca DW4/3-1]|uniref:Uncharacterized protein n=1 Tax=Stigmatella aurantiaca (strain DW4/3-1) TaxID=378806 RepID=Q095D1_STIAD|nr:hypothetical protein STIAU_7050 [Stigmatella aurantiaca DW4/3-1]
MVRLDALCLQRLAEPGHVQLLVGGHLVMALGHLEAGPGRAGEGVGIVLLVDVAAAGVGARLEEGPQPPLGVALADGGDRLPDGGGMVREVVHDQDAAGLTAHLLAALHPAEAGEPPGNLLEREPQPPRRGDDAQRVLHVVEARELHPRRAQHRAPLHHLEAGALGAEGDLPGGVIRLRAFPGHIGDHPGPRAARDAQRVRVRGAHHELPLWRNEPDELLEGGLVVRQVPEDVRVVKLHAGQDGGARLVVQELGTLVPVGRVVLIPLHDEVRPLAHAVVARVVLGDTAHQEGRILSRVHQHVGHQRGGGRLAVGPGHHHRVGLLEEEGTERRGEAHLRQAAGPHLGGLGVHPADDVADDGEVGLGRIQVFRAIGGDDGNAPRLEHVAHGGIDVLVAPGHLVARRLEHAREGAHARARHAQQVDAAHGPRREGLQNVSVVVSHDSLASVRRVSRGPTPLSPGRGRRGGSRGYGSPGAHGPPGW